MGTALRPSDAGPVAFEVSRVGRCSPHIPPAPYLQILANALAFPQLCAAPLPRGRTLLVPEACFPLYSVLD